MWGLLLKSEAIRSILDTDSQKSGSYRRGLLPRRKNRPCDLMVGCASADITGGTARTSIIRHSLMSMIPSESSISHINLLTRLVCLRRRTRSITNDRSPGWSVLRCCHGITQGQGVVDDLVSPAEWWASSWAAP